MNTYSFSTDVNKRLLLRYRHIVSGGVRDKVVAFIAFRERIPTNLHLLVWKVFGHKYQKLHDSSFVMVDTEVFVFLG